MADTPIFNLIPASLRSDLLEECKQILADKQKQNESKVDPDMVAFAKKQNEQALLKQQALKSKNKKQ